MGCHLPLPASGWSAGSCVVSSTAALLGCKTILRPVPSHKQWNDRAHLPFGHSTPLPKHVFVNDEICANSRNGSNSDADGVRPRSARARCSITGNEIV